MQDINVNLGRNSYRVKVGGGILAEIGSILNELGFAGRAALITNPDIGALYSECVTQSLRRAGLRPAAFEIPEGEGHKSLAWASNIYSWFCEQKMDRSTPVLALGGGVIGDLAGFAAATYMRGLPLIQLPTTLLAQVDSSVGGKVAVNFGQFKNIIGSFYQPRLVMADVSALGSLPLVEIENGLAEVIKYGIIQDKDLFGVVERNIERLKNRDVSNLEQVVYRCASIKASIVEQDETDLGLRNILNFGHTAGHAIEAVSNFRIPHGRAVGAGMVIGALVARRLGFLSYAELDRIRSVVASAGLPIGIHGLDVGAIVEAMKHDKKRSNTKMRFVLPKGIGSAFVSEDVPLSLVGSVMENMP